MADVLPLRAFRRLDLNAVEAGVPLRHLMAKAGRALAQAVRDAANPGDRVVLLCGKGNNGGDGFAAAGVLLRWGFEAHVVLLAPRQHVQGTAKGFMDLLPEDRVADWGPDRRAWKDAAVVVDCMLGSGLRGAPRKPYDQAIRWMNRHDGCKIACDVPTGLGHRLVITPDVTVTFHAEKEGMAGKSGRIHVADIGLPKEANDVGIGDLDAGYPRLDPEGHKGDHGRVLVIGGGPFAGAPHYAGMGAVRTGADLVHAAVPMPAAQAVQNWGPDLLVHAIGHDHFRPSDVPALTDLAAHVDALVIGPGLGKHPESLVVVRAILDATACPAVLDADALRALDDAALAAHASRLLLTPHGAEFARLAGAERTAANVTRFAKRHGVAVLAKGPVDVISDGHTTRMCRRGHPAMTKGGTGDVLAGTCGALLSKGVAPFDAACAAAYLVGRAGEQAAALRGPGMCATDLHESIPAILNLLA